ncbi:hypothetical protein [Enhygromyxa salina]|uniref:Uncharacterized protein n=1 Tax=Enhygromyxa salina TaxID=215803 RepID=A0A2S9XNK2_9BACT|nr:hypothetical protein [Enhygromyxa salina]PRP94449.1 hypothetical protein ENSA7_77830 [Enhygromyxa salina]
MNDNYTHDRARPIAGGGVDELAHAKVASRDLSRRFPTTIRLWHARKSALCS